MLHLADATAECIKAARMQTIGLLGTNFTIEQNFYKGRLIEKHGLNVLVPPKADRDLVHRVIYDELCLGVVKDASRDAYLRLYRHLRQRAQVLRAPLRAGDTPYKFAEVFVQRIAEMAQQRRGGELLVPAGDEIRALIQIYIYAWYAPDVPDFATRRQAVWAWCKLRWRLWLAWFWRKTAWRETPITLFFLGRSQASSSE